MTTYLFVGPSLPDAREHVASGIKVLPPVAGGDLLRLPLVAGDSVGIVDGLFHQQHAVRHKEILAVLADGVRVLGAASIGALRAAELHPFGMEGVGGIYRDYRDGVLEADDEVALVHGPAEADYRPFSQPLVNIRATLEAAQAAGLLDRPTCRRLVESMAAMSYHQRTYQRLAEITTSLRMPDAMARALLTFCTEQPVDRKREDALELVGRLREVRAGRSRPRFELSRTIHLRQWQSQARGTDTGDGYGWIGDLEVLRTCQLFATDFPRIYRTFVLDQIAGECAAQCDQPGSSDARPVDAAIAHGVHRGIYPPLADPDGFAFLRAWLTPAEWETLDLRARVGIYLVRGYAVAPGVRDLAAIAAATVRTPACTAARTLVDAARVVNERSGLRRPDFDLQSLSARRIAEWFAMRWGCAVADLDFAALDRGLDSRAVLIATARPYYLAARYNPELTRVP